MQICEKGSRPLNELEYSDGPDREVEKYCGVSRDIYDGCRKSRRLLNFA